MKDGKVYQGRIMGETFRSILITSPAEPRPQFLRKRDVLTIVRDQPEEKVFVDRGRYVSLRLGLSGNFYSSDRLELDPAPGLTVGGGFRFHPAAEIEGGLDWVPALSGILAISDGTVTRQYEKFRAFGGFFGLRLFPFYRFQSWPVEPYLLGGYQWTRLNPKATDDGLKGKAFLIGSGFEKRFAEHWAWDVRFHYERLSYDRVDFLLREGSLTDDIRLNRYRLVTGLSYRFF